MTKTTNCTGQVKTGQQKPNLAVVVDSREQLAYQFAGPHYEGATIEQATLPVGDYSLPGLFDWVAVERKSVDDLIQCLCKERERFERELLRGQALDAFAVVVECSWADLAKGNYRSKMQPQSAINSLLAFMARYRVSFILAGNRQAGEYATFNFLRHYLRRAMDKLKAITKAQGAA